jgi:murein DD-endopeptidase MepM/ murein hydrolase activator NlpD
VRRPGLALAAASALLAAAAACHPLAPPPMHPETPAGRWYVLDRTETVDDVASAAGVPVEDILELNGLTRAEVVPGKLIFLPEGSPVPPSPAVPAPAPASWLAPAPPPAPARAPAAAQTSAPLPLLAIAGGGGGGPAPPLRWPLDPAGLIVASPFGARGGRAHDGIDLPAPIGTPVYAAAAGRVLYAGDGVHGYGNLVVVQHAGDLLTVYAHNAVLLVRAGQTVRAGERVALTGQSGRATGPHLHFEVRQGQIPRDPMPLLPTLSVTTARPGATP